MQPPRATLQHNLFLKSISLQDIPTEFYVNILFCLSSWDKNMTFWVDILSMIHMRTSTHFTLLNSLLTLFFQIRQQWARTVQLPLQQWGFRLQMRLQIWLRAIKASIKSTLISLKCNLLLQSPDLTSRTAETQQREKNISQTRTGFSEGSPLHTFSSQVFLIGKMQTFVF